MTKAEMILFLYLIDDKENTDKPLRKIAAETGLSLGSVQGIMAELSRQGFIVRVRGKKMLRKRSTLIDRWAGGYAEENKSKQFIARFRFLSPAIKENWREIQLGSNAYWGGEPAVFLLDGYLRPGRWDVYVEEKADCLIKTARMIPDPEGDIFVYKKFWGMEGVPAVVVYADLLSIDDDRCREAAMRIKEGL